MRFAEFRERRCVGFLAVRPEKGITRFDAQALNRKNRHTTMALKATRLLDVKVHPEQIARIVFVLQRDKTLMVAAVGGPDQ